MLEEALGKTVPQLPPCIDVRISALDRRLAHVGAWGGIFPVRLPLEVRSERGAPVGVLVSRNGGCRKKFPGGKVFRQHLWVVGIDHTAKP